MNRMNIKKGIISLFIVALTFGISYVFQAMANGDIGPFSFNTARYFLAFIPFIPFLFKKDETTLSSIIEVMIVLGLVLSLASALQQMAAGKISSGKVGFITSLYIVMVPLIEALIFRKSLNHLTILSILICLCGLYLLCGIKDLLFGKYELLVLTSAFLYAIEIIYIDKKASKMNPYKFTFALCFGTFVFSSIFALGEKMTIINFQKALIPILYVGIFAGCIGYFFQTYGQKNSNDTLASLIMSLESVVSLIAGFLFLNQCPTILEFMGCVFMFLGVVLCIIANKK